MSEVHINNTKTNYNLQHCIMINVVTTNRSLLTPALHINNKLHHKIDVAWLKPSQSCKKKINSWF